MKKTILLTITFMLGLTLIGCGPEKMATSAQPIQGVAVSDSEGFRGGSQEFIWTSEKQEEIEAFEQLISSASRESIQAKPPIYDMTIDYGEGETGGERLIHLTETSDGHFALMYAGHENKTYLANKSSTDKVKKLLP
ncbi:hypothetical protein [Marinococcus halophilus]|uniref:hypothetical protein n=1 Tax=Marinococcus halophilus TaxID=1371 RepID=UPI0009A895D6|nr:hypothetical protein [Marinococcus halophilus]